MVDLTKLQLTTYVLKPYIESDYSGSPVIIKDYNYVTKYDNTDPSAKPTKTLTVLVEYENGYQEWRKFSDLEEYIPEAEKQIELSTKFKSLDAKVLKELRICMLAGICMGGIPAELICAKDDLELVLDKIKQFRTNN